MKQLITTLGPRQASDLGLILPHEHVFVDLRPPTHPEHGQADPDDVVRLMAPAIRGAQAAGVTAIVECSTVGVGRRADIDRAVSEATGFPLVVPTGVYREPWIPQWVHDSPTAKLRDWMLDELTGQIEESGVQAGWIKLSAGDNGLTDCEARVLEAAAMAGKATNAVIGSHTISGRVVRRQLDIVEHAGYSPERFIWIHTHVEPDFRLHLEAARRGAWIEYDALGSEWLDDKTAVNLIQRVLDAGLIDHLLISHDRGWYDPALPGGGSPQPYTYISETLLGQLRAAGIGDDAIQQITEVNPFRAFAR